MHILSCCKYTGGQSVWPASFFSLVLYLPLNTLAKGNVFLISLTPHKSCPLLNMHILSFSSYFLPLHHLLRLAKCQTVGEGDFITDKLSCSFFLLLKVHMDAITKSF